MTKTIEQSVRFTATPEDLFETYLDSKRHSAATGGVAQMSRKAGGKFTAWGGQLCGRNLMIIPNKMIVQAWRANHWKASDPDSILILRFSQAPEAAKLISPMRTSRLTTTRALHRAGRNTIGNLGRNI